MSKLRMTMFAFLGMTIVFIILAFYQSITLEYGDRRNEWLEIGYNLSAGLSIFLFGLDEYKTPEGTVGAAGFIGMSFLAALFLIPGVVSLFLN
ncbi:hypothetical protein [Shouchella shacheensis]|uniref:hypothetical protein n=1 Tax=Shouchella shacheensis TaxID=1649580 RepID=UPI00073FC7AF|nr:hypothetical protein [Shouchella shacheensis]